MATCYRLPKNCCYPSALVLAPSRELVQQVHAEASRMMQRSHLKAVAVTGGETIAEQVGLKAGAGVWQACLDSQLVTASSMCTTAACF